MDCRYTMDKEAKELQRLREVNAKLVEAIQEAHARIDAYYDQESYEGTNLFKASEILAVAIQEANS